MRGIVVMLLGLFIVIYSIYDSLDGEFEVANRSGGRVIYQIDDPSKYRNSVIGQSFIGLVAMGLGFWVWRSEKK